MANKQNVQKKEMKHGAVISRLKPIDLFKPDAFISKQVIEKCRKYVLENGMANIISPGWQYEDFAFNIGQYMYPKCKDIEKLVWFGLWTYG